MSWIRSSKGITLLAVLALTVAAVGTVAAVSVSTDAPEEAQVGNTISVTVTISDVYEDSQNWRLNATTELTDVTGWEVTKVSPTGATNTTTFQNASIGVPVRSSEKLKQINVTVTGTVPEVSNYSFEPRQTFAAMTLTRISGNRAHDIETVTVHHYTTKSHGARQLIEEAQSVVNGSSKEAQSDLESAISSFESGNFQNAKKLANDAIDAAESAQQSQNTMQLILYGVGAIIVLALLGGGIYYYRSQQDDYDKLR